MYTSAYHSYTILGKKKGVDQRIQRVIISLCLNRISKNFYQINRLPLHQNQSLAYLSGYLWKRCRGCFDSVGSLSKTYKITVLLVNNSLAHLAFARYENPDIQAKRHWHTLTHILIRVHGKKRHNTSSVSNRIGSFSFHWLLCDSLVAPNWIKTGTNVISSMGLVDGRGNVG